MTRVNADRDQEPVLKLAGPLRILKQALRKNLRLCSLKFAGVRVGSLNGRKNVEPFGGAPNGGDREPETFGPLPKSSEVFRVWKHPRSIGVREQIATK